MNRRHIKTRAARLNIVTRCLILFKYVFKIRNRCVLRPLSATILLLLLPITIVINQHFSEVSQPVDVVPNFSQQIPTNVVSDQPRHYERESSQYTGVNLKLNNSNNAGNNRDHTFGTKSSALTPFHEFLWPQAGTHQLKVFFPTTTIPHQKGLKSKQLFVNQDKENMYSTALYSQSMLSPLAQRLISGFAENAAVGLFLAIVVVSKPNNVLLRQAARQTWSKDAHEMSVVVRFVVGKMDNWDEIVQRENLIHNDVIIMEIEDTYENLPTKVLSGFSWLLSQPTIPKYIMKVDDDTIVNLPYLLEELQSGVINTSQILGAICINSTVIRDSRDKWAVSFLDFPFPQYPQYAFGGGYVMSSSAAATLIRTKYRSTDWVHLEDVYITGMLASKSHISHVSHKAFSYWMTDKASPCDFMQDKRITSVNHTVREFFKFYSDIQVLLRSRDVNKCRKLKEK